MVEQGSQEWHNLRIGLFTASEFWKLMSKKDTKTYQDYLNKKVFQRITGKSPDEYVSPEMIYGTETESEARESYRFDNLDKKVELAEFYFLESDPEWVGASPDGLVDSDGLLEIKCPKWNTLIDYHLKDRFSKNYYWQMQGQLWVTNREYCDFYAYHPELKPYTKRIERNNQDIIKLMREIVMAKREVLRRIEVLV